VNALRRRLKPLTWLALVAMLALALVPAVSHALAFAQGGKSAWAEICTPQGMKVVAQLADDEGAPATGAGLLEHCPFCTPAASALGMPPAPAAVQTISEAGIELPPLFFQAPRTSFAWAAAQPRAPPSVS
jgi:hypothetical protein